MMISETVVRAACQRYTRAELVAKRDAALAEMEKGSTIVSVNTGAGTSYSRAVQVTPQEAVEFWQRSIDWLDEQEGVSTAPASKINLVYTGGETC